MLRTALYLLALAVPAEAANKTAENRADGRPVYTAEKSAVRTAKPLRRGPMWFTATAYSTKGNTVKGVQTQPGIVAADRKILPLGSTIRVTCAGRYSGLYVVTDVGTAIVGRRVDIFVTELLAPVKEGANSAGVSRSRGDQGRSQVTHIGGDAVGTLNQTLKISIAIPIDSRHNGGSAIVRSPVDESQLNSPRCNYLDHQPIMTIRVAVGFNTRSSALRRGRRSTFTLLWTALEGAAL
jgi:3D (Asp-Asp-Asp) domain-containing protein